MSSGLRIVILPTLVLMLALARSARGQAWLDSFDIANGGWIVVASPIEPGPGSLIDDTAAPTIFRDSNGPAGTVDLVKIGVFPDHPSTIVGVTLYTLADGGVEDGTRGVSNFRLLASTTSPLSPPDVVLIDGVNPRDDGSPNTYLFPPVAIWAVDALFTRATDAGPRVVELNSMAIPEPQTAGALAAGMGLLMLRRCRGR